MAELANVFRFRLRALGDTKAEWRTLGSIDGAGTSLIDVLCDGMKTFAHEIEIVPDEKQPEVIFDRLAAVGAANEVGAFFVHHRYGHRGVLNRRLANDRIPFEIEDSQEVQVGALVRADPMKTVGFVARHEPTEHGGSRGRKRKGSRTPIQPAAARTSARCHR